MLQLKVRNNGVAHLMFGFQLLLQLDDFLLHQLLVLFLLVLSLVNLLLEVIQHPLLELRIEFVFLYLHLELKLLRVEGLRLHLLAFENGLRFASFLLLLIFESLFSQGILFLLLEFLL